MFNSIDRRFFRKKTANLLLLVGLSLASCSTSNYNPASTQTQIKVINMKLTSDAFTNNGFIPAKYTCDDKNISPQLKWDTPPINTKSLVLIVDDPDAPGQTFVHWIVYNLPPETLNLPEAIPNQSTLQGGGIQGKNDFGKFGYGGPCPPSGTHRYFFKLYALDQLLELKLGTTKKQLEESMDNHIIASSQLIGHYSRKQ